MTFGLLFRPCVKRERVIIRVDNLIYAYAKIYSFIIRIDVGCRVHSFQKIVDVIGRLCVFLCAFGQLHKRTPVKHFQSILEADGRGQWSLYV